MDKTGLQASDHQNRWAFGFELGHQWRHLAQLLDFVQEMRNVGLHVIVSLLLRRGHDFPDLTMIHKEGAVLGKLRWSMNFCLFNGAAR
jgi:hypothetical protein